MNGASISASPGSAEPIPDPPPYLPRGRRLSLWGLLSASVFLAGLATVFSLAGRWYWALDVLTHFRVQYFWLFSVAGGLLAIGRRWRWAMVSGGLAVLNALLILPIWLGPGRQPVQPGQRVCKALLLNVFTANRTPGKVLDLIAAEQPDIVILQEVNAAWMRRLSVLDADYPVRLAEPEEDNFGIALYSKLPLVAGAVEHFGRVQVASIVATLQLDGAPLTVIGTHPLPPGGAFYSELRDEQLVRLAERVRAVEGPVLLLGDLNTTSWSPVFRQLLRDSGLRDSRHGIGIQPTWPTFIPVLRVPLDHALVSHGIVVHDRRRGPETGSDHFPVLLHFSLLPENP